MACLMLLSQFMDELSLEQRIFWFTSHIPTHRITLVYITPQASGGVTIQPIMTCYDPVIR